MWTRGEFFFQILNFIGPHPSPYHPTIFHKPSLKHHNHIFKPHYYKSLSLFPNHSSPLILSPSSIFSPKPPLFSKEKASTFYLISTPIPKQRSQKLHCPPPRSYFRAQKSQNSHFKISPFHHQWHPSRAIRANK